MRDFRIYKNQFIIYRRLAEDYLDELAQDYRIRRAYPQEALTREKRGMRNGKSISPNAYQYQGNDPLWNAEW